MVGFRRLATCLALVVLALGLDIAARAEPAPPGFALPIACKLPDDCFVEFYVDRTPGPDISDYRCGNRTYDSHRGTDFRVRSMRRFNAGVPVLAAAPGVVVALRDDMPDIDVVEFGREHVYNRAAGNVVVLRHPGDWTTAYFHLRRGSIRVKIGDAVQQGQQLGLVGLSGDTNFPHLHFEVRRDQDVVVDPFAGAEATTSCSRPGTPLWTTSAMAQLAYRSIEAGGAGFASTKPTRNDAIYDRLANRPPHAGKGGLFFWFEMFGIRDGDTISVQFVLPSGVARKAATRKYRGDVSYLYDVAGLNVSGTLAPGRYQARLSVSRQGQAEPVFSRVYSIDLR